MRRLAVLPIIAGVIALSGCGITVTVNDSPKQAKQDFIAYVEANYVKLEPDDENIVLLIGKEICDSLNDYGPDWLGDFRDVTEGTAEWEMSVVIIDSASRYLCPKYEDDVSEWLDTL